MSFATRENGKTTSPSQILSLHIYLTSKVTPPFHIPCSIVLFVVGLASSPVDVVRFRLWFSVGSFDEEALLREGRDQQRSMVPGGRPETHKLHPKTWWRLLAFTSTGCWYFSPFLFFFRPPPTGVLFFSFGKFSSMPFCTTWLHAFSSVVTFFVVVLLLLIVIILAFHKYHCISNWRLTIVENRMDSSYKEKKEVVEPFFERDKCRWSLVIWYISVE